jgi:hypothetical protein
MTAAKLLAEAQAAGVAMTVAAGRLRLSAAREPPANLVDRLRAHKAELIELLTGARCRHCGGALDWRRPDSVAFVDGTGAHLACYEAAEVERLLATGRRTCRE